MNQYDLVLFDMDGTLLSSLGAHVRMFTRFWAESPLNPGNGGLRPDAAPTIWDIFRDTGLPRSALKTLYDELAVFYRERATGEDLAALRFVPQAEGLLSRLRNGGVRTALVTNSHWALAGRIVRENGAEDWFDAVSGSTAEEEDKQTRMQRLMDDFDVPPDRTLYVGDNESDVRTARATGCDCCIVLTRISWVKSVETLMREVQPDYTVCDLARTARIVL